MINIIEEKCKLSNIERASTDPFLQKTERSYEYFEFNSEFVWENYGKFVRMMFVLQSNSVR